MFMLDCRKSMRPGSRVTFAFAKTASHDHLFCQWSFVAQNNSPWLLWQSFHFFRECKVMFQIKCLSLLNVKMYKWPSPNPVLTAFMHMCNLCMNGCTDGWTNQLMNTELLAIYLNFFRFLLFVCLVFFALSFFFFFFAMGGKNRILSQSIFSRCSVIAEFIKINMVQKL